MSGYFPEPKSSGGSLKVDLDFHLIMQKMQIWKNTTGVDTSKFVKMLTI